MRTTLLALALSLFVGSGASAQIPLNQVHVLNTSENVLSFPATSTITNVAFVPNALQLNYTKQGVWPPIMFGDAQQESTLWIIGNFGGEWYAAGMERLRPNQTNKPEGGDPRSFIADWVQGRNFGPFNDHVFQNGETIGLFVVAGNSRLASDFIVRERTSVIQVPFNVPGGAPLWVEGGFMPPPVPTPTPVPAPVPMPAPLPSIDVSVLIAQLNVIDAHLGVIETKLAQHDTDDKKWQEQVRTTWKTYVVPFAKYVAPALGAWIAGHNIGK